MYYVAQFLREQSHTVVDWGPGRHGDPPRARPRGRPRRRPPVTPRDRYVRPVCPSPGSAMLRNPDCIIRIQSSAAAAAPSLPKARPGPP